jgi:rSAM/selenodomain-associated transferase 1
MTSNQFKHSETVDRPERLTTSLQSNPGQPGEDPDLSGHQASSNQFALLIFAKYPEPRRVKTRLAASIGHEAAAALYAKFVRAILKLGEQSNAKEVFVAVAPPERIGDFKKEFAGRYTLFAQIESENLGERIIAAAQHVQANGYEKILIIGADSPNLPVEFLREAAAALSTHDVVLGPAEDGGYYLIGMTKIHPKLFDGIAWSTSAVLAQTLEQARSLKLRVYVLAAWYDVDELPSYQRLVRDNPEFSCGK